MRVVDDAWCFEDLGALTGGGAGTVGNYDGIHCGQQEILRRVVERAKALDRPAVVVTFEPHPLEVLRPDEAPARITTSSQKERLLAAAGIDVVALIEFDAEMAQTSAHEFARDFLFGRMDLAELFVGSRFVFGRGREGDLEMLQSVAAESSRSAHGVDEVVMDAEAVSSTRVRQALEAGDVGQAGKLLGRPYELEGEVTKGAGKGRELGWPTINLKTDNELLPAHGVYASRVRIGTESVTLPAVTNVGTRPTIHQDKTTTVESFIFDFDRDLYGETVGVELLARLRGEKRFGGVEELVAQIARDAQDAREFLIQLG